MDFESRRNGSGIFMPGRLKLSVYMNYGLLTVHVMRGNKLTRKPNPSTFIMIALIPVESDTTPTRCRTNIIKGTNSPVYEEKFSFELSDDDMNKRLLISAVTRDSASHHQESLGCMSFGLRNIKEGREINGWYFLLEDNVGLHKHRHVIVKERPHIVPAPEPKPISAINQDVRGMEVKEISVNRPIRGEYGFTLVDSCPVRVGQCDVGSSAEEAGILQGDIVVRVNGFNVSRSTSVSVAKMVKRSGNMVFLEIHRVRQATPVSMEMTFAPSTMGQNSDTAYSASSVQEFTICDERAALLESAISVDTRRQAALHRLLCLEENFVDLMNIGVQRFSRPLRHCLLTRAEHQRLFQNVEKIVCMSEFQVCQIVSNLPCQGDGSDDEDDSMYAAQSQDITWMVGMIYLSKLPVLCQAYTSYAAGLTRAAEILSDLESDLDFHSFLYNIPQQQGRELGLCEFINRPLTHAKDLCVVMEMIAETTLPGSLAQKAYQKVVRGLKACVSTLQNASNVTTRIISPSASIYSMTTDNNSTSTSGSYRRVPMMGSKVLKRAHSVQSSTSGFGSASSQSSGEHGGPRETVV